MTPPWFTVTRAGTSAYASILSDIGADGNGAKEFSEAVGDAKRIELSIDSAGGCSRVALGVYELLRPRKNTVATVTGACFSAAMTILASCKRRRMVRSASLMTHEAKVFVIGGPEGLRIAADHVARIEQELNEICARRTRQPIATVRAWHKSGDKYWTAEQALKARLVDSIIEAPAAPLPEITAPAQASLQVRTDEERLLLDLLGGFERIPTHDRKRLLQDLSIWASRAIREET